MPTSTLWAYHECNIIFLSDTWLQEHILFFPHLATRHNRMMRMTDSSKIRIGTSVTVKEYLCTLILNCWLSVSVSFIYQAKSPVLPAGTSCDIISSVFEFLSTSSTTSKCIHCDIWSCSVSATLQLQFVNWLLLYFYVYLLINSPSVILYCDSIISHWVKIKYYSIKFHSCLKVLMFANWL